MVSLRSLFHSEFSFRFSSRIFSLQAKPINPTDLSLSTPLSKEVNGKIHYRQFIRLAGAKVILTTSNFVAEKLEIRGEGKNLSVLVPTQGTLRTQLNILESFVTAKVTFPAGLTQPSDCKAPLYKSLWQADKMFVSLSPRCDFNNFNKTTEENAKTTKEGPFGQGIYHVTLEAPYIYIGEHKDGNLFSLSLRVVQVIYQPSPLISIANNPSSPLSDDSKKLKKGAKSSKKTVPT